VNKEQILLAQNTIIDIATALQTVGGDVGLLKGISLVDFISICVNNNLEITVKYKENKC